MTNENTMMGGVAVTNMPVSSDSKTGKSPVMMGKEDLAEVRFEDTILVQEEDKMMEDEEVTSVESNGEVEDTMFTMALMNSVADQRGAGEPVQPDQAQASDQPRLRKRRRSDEEQPVCSAVPNPLSNPLKPPRPLPNVKVDSELLAPNPVVSSEVLDPVAEGKRKVCFEEPTTRARGFSIDLDFACALVLGDDPEYPVGTEGIPESEGRSRAFSFECLAFDPTLDDHAIPLSMENEIQRPRGDSIIFDPTSFQEGGIHEQAALSRCGSSVSPVPDSISSVPSMPTEPPTIKGPKVTAFTANTAVGITASGSTTLPMELLNKGGRIGIYLPEARRARIARFHAKRSKRVWRKRIKYDCRKKLADSRPRVKGRFVKRAD